MNAAQHSVHPLNAPIFNGLGMVPGHPKGWALPGGRITSDRAKAERCAAKLDRMIQANGGMNSLRSGNHLPLMAHEEEAN